MKRKSRLVLLLSKPKSGAVLVAKDTFTGTDYDFIGSGGVHVPEIGGAWDVLEGNGCIKSNQLACYEYLDPFVRAVQSLAVSDGVLELDALIAPVYTGFIFRYQDANNYWKCYADTTSGRLVINEVVSGVDTPRITSDALGIANGDTLHLTMTLNGESMVFACSGDREGAVSYVSSSGQSATKHGIMMIGSGFTGRMDNWQMTANP